MADNWVTKSVSGKAPQVTDIEEPHIDEDILDDNVVVLIQGTNVFGDAVYSYLELTLRNLRELSKKMRRKENFKPADFGTVKAAGRGEPPPEVKTEMAVTYNLVDLPQPEVKQTLSNFRQPKFGLDNGEGN